MIAVFLTDGFEMIEALAPVDILTRGGFDVKLVSLTGKELVKSTHGVEVKTSLPFSSLDADSLEMMILPGGMPGAENLSRHEGLCSLLKQKAEEELPICAICAAPIVLGRLGLLEGRRATCYPGFEADLIGASHSESGLVCDRNILTAKGMGLSIDFGLAALEMLSSRENRKAMAKTILAV